MPTAKKTIEEIKAYRKEFYNNRSSIYDNLSWTDKSHPEILGFKNNVKVKKGDIVLDIATGTGQFLLEMAKDGANCFGIDISQKMLEQIKPKIEHLRLQDNIKELRVGEADNLPYPIDLSKHLHPPLTIFLTQSLSVIHHFNKDGVKF